MLLLDDLRSALSRGAAAGAAAGLGGPGPDHGGIPGYDPGRGSYRQASVLVVIYGRGEPAVIMTKKSRHLKIHASEISFPGGKLDACDGSDLLQAALRETREEIGLSVPRDRVTGRLDPVVTLNSGFLISPFVCVMESVPPLLANPEVESILHIPLEPLLATIMPDTDPSHNLIREMYTFTYLDQTVWGASARILKQIRDRVAPS